MAAGRGRPAVFRHTAPTSSGITRLNSASAHLACRRDEIEELIGTSVRRAEQAEPPAAGSPEAKRDDLAALLSALAAVYEAAPQLWLDPELR